MTVIATVTTLARDTKTAELDVTVDGVPATTYSVTVDGTVTITALVDTTVAVDGATGWFQFLADVQRFTALVDQEIPPGYAPLGLFFQREILDATTLAFRVEQGAGFVLVRATYTIATRSILFKARAGTTMGWRDFKRWYAFFQVIAADIRNLP